MNLAKHFAKAKGFNRHFEAAKGLGLKRAVWSIYEVTDHMDDVACHATGLTLVYKEHWSDDVGPVSVVLPNNPTWRDLAKAADTAIIKSKDDHHVFIEAFDFDGNATITLWTGS